MGTKIVYKNCLLTFSVFFCILHLVLGCEGLWQAGAEHSKSGLNLSDYR